MKRRSLGVIAALTVAGWLLVALVVTLAAAVGMYWCLFAVLIVALLIGWGHELVTARRRRLARAAETDAAINHTDDCTRCAPARARLQLVDPLHGMDEDEFVERARRRSRPDVDDAGRWATR